MTESIKNTVIGGAFTIIGAAIGAYGMYLSSANSDETIEQKYQLLQDENEQLKETIEELENEISSLESNSSNDSDGESISDAGSEEEPLSTPISQNDNAVSAFDLEPLHENRVEFDKKSTKDRKGNAFSKAIVLGHIKLLEDVEARYYNLEYYLGKEYSKLICTLGFSEENTGYRGEQTLFLDIYADEKLINTFGPITEKSDPIPVNIDITNSEYIELITYTEENSDWDFSYDIKLIVDDLQFCK